MEDKELTKEDREFIEWLKTVDQKTFNKIMRDTEKEIFRDGGKFLNEKGV